MRKLIRSFAIFAIAMTTFGGAAALADSCTANADCGAYCNAYGPSVSCTSGSNYAWCRWFKEDGSLGGSYYYTC